jgi:hypothetical protein
VHLVVVIPLDLASFSLGFPSPTIAFDEFAACPK